MSLCGEGMDGVELDVNKRGSTFNNGRSVQFDSLFD
jgi:hypothetical protein